MDFTELRLMPISGTSNELNNQDIFVHFVISTALSTREELHNHTQIAVT